MKRRRFLQSMLIGSAPVILGDMGCAVKRDAASMGNRELLTRLRQVDRDAAVRFPSDFDSGLGQLGLILTEDLRHGGYQTTPKNSLSFAHTSGEGVHFSFVTRKGDIADDSPVIVTVPEAASENKLQGNYVVGENLYDFLCLGVHRAYFAMEQFGLRHEKAVVAYADPSWQPTTDYDKHVGYDHDEHESAVLAFLVNELNLVPWTDVPGKLRRLETKYGPEIELGSGYGS